MLIRMSLFDGVFDILLKSCFTGDDTKSANGEPSKPKASSQDCCPFEFDKTESDCSASNSSADTYKEGLIIGSRDTTFAESIAEFKIHNTLASGRFGRNYWQPIHHQGKW